MTAEKKKTHIYFRCSEELKEALVEIARQSERSLSSQCVYFLKQAVADFPVEKDGNVVLK